MNTTRKIGVVATVAMLAMSTLTHQALACSKDGKEGFLPKNTMYIPVRRVVLDRAGNPLGGGITEAEFNGVISVVEKIYTPIVKEMGGNLVLHRKWTDGTVNAYADREDGNWNVTMFGGLARHKETTIDGFLLVLCHELGHQIGGAPKYDRGEGENGWAANEGQSDYFATLKCARRVLQKEPNLRAIRTLDAPDAVRVACRKSFQNDNEAALCIRDSMGGLSLARLLAGGGRMPDFTTPDTSKVSETDDSHPDAQCRLDTYYHGSLCPVDFRADVDQKDPLVNTCSQEKGDNIAHRPRCWYAPQSNNTTLKVARPRTPFRGRVL